MFQVKCPLGHVLEIGESHFGQRLMCPGCEAVMHVSHPPPGEIPVAKYEVRCAKGHILRVKQKYLNKEVRCPSCKTMVSMKPQQLLNAKGATLGTAKPELFKKLPPRQQVPAAKVSPVAPSAQEPPATIKTPRLTSKVPSERIPPPPSARLDGDTHDDSPPLPPEIVEESSIQSTSLPVKQNNVAAPTLSDDDFEFEVVDTQFHLELGESGLEVPKAPPVIKKPKTGHIEQPPPRQAPPPMTTMVCNPKIIPPVVEDPTPAPTGLHPLTTSEMMKVQQAALQPEEPALVQFTCPNGHILELEAQYRGMQVQCPLCQQIFELPKS